VHDRVKVVGRSQIAELVNVSFLKVVHFVICDVSPNNVHVLVSIFIVLHVIKAERVHLIRQEFKMYPLKKFIDINSPAHE
jgi:hypothetical protein